MGCTQKQSSNFKIQNGKCQSEPETGMSLLLTSASAFISRPDFRCFYLLKCQTKGTSEAQLLARIHTARVRLILLNIQNGNWQCTSIYIQKTDYKRSVPAFTSSGAEMSNKMWPSTASVWRLMAKLAPIAFYFLVFFLLISTFFEMNFTVDALMSKTRDSLYGKVLRLIVINVSGIFLIF